MISIELNLAIQHVGNFIDIAMLVFHEMTANSLSPNRQIGLNVLGVWNPHGYKKQPGVEYSSEKDFGFFGVFTDEKGNLETL